MRTIIISLAAVASALAGAPSASAADVFCSIQANIQGGGASFTGAFNCTEPVGNCTVTAALLEDDTRAVPTQVAVTEPELNCGVSKSTEAQDVQFPFVDQRVHTVASFRLLTGGTLTWGAGGSSVAADCVRVDSISNTWRCTANSAVF